MCVREIYGGHNGGHLYAKVDTISIPFQTWNSYYVYIIHVFEVYDCHLSLYMMYSALGILASIEGDHTHVCLTVKIVQLLRSLFFMYINTL